jgi:hypothetical protein
LIRLAGLHAGQFAAHVDLVDHDLEVHGVAGVGLGGLRGVAHDAAFHGAARPAVESKPVVALVAALGADDIAGSGFGTGGDPGESVVVVVGAEVEFGEIAISVD